MCIDGSNEVFICSTRHCQECSQLWRILSIETKVNRTPLSHILVGSTDRLALRRLYSYFLKMASTAHQPSLVRIAPFVRFVGQLHSTILANVAIDMEVFVHRYNPNRLLGALDWCNTCANNA